MLVSQIGYIGCIITPTDEQLKILQSLIDTYVKSSTVIAADRLYLKPAEGGLGLINLTSYIAALQCSWIKRCSLVINDPWRWNLAAGCNFQLDLVRTDNINGALSPICLNIAKSFSCLQNVYWKLHENFLNAPLVDNCFFLRQEPERRRPARGCVDRNLLGRAFYDNNKEALRNLRMSCMLRGDRVVSHDLLIRTTGLNFSEACYMHLSTAAAFAKKKYANKNGSNGTSLPLKWLIQQVKKGSKRYRTLIDRHKNEGHDISNLRVVKTFFELLDCPVPEKNRIQAIHGS
jgi:hypothetical protein